MDADVAEGAEGILDVCVAEDETKERAVDEATGAEVGEDEETALTEVDALEEARKAGLSCVELGAMAVELASRPVALALEERTSCRGSKKIWVDALELLDRRTSQ